MDREPSSTNAKRLVASITESAEYLGVSEPTVWRMLRDGQLARIRVRGRTLVRYCDLEALLAGSDVGKVA